MRFMLPLIAIFLFCALVPVVEISYPTIESIPVAEEYTTIEPYTVTEEVTVPYASTSTTAVWHDGGLGEWKREFYTDPEQMLEDFGNVQPGYYTIRQYPTTSYRVEERAVTKYREVTKTRVVTRAVVVPGYKRVSLFQSIFGK